MGTIAVPNTFTANTTISSSQVNSNFSTVYNEFNGNIAAANLATDAVTTAKIAADAVTAAKIADGAIDATAKLADDVVTDAKLDYPRFWQEIGRTTLGSAGDTITVSSLPARKYLRILMTGIATGGTLDTSFIFNGDTGANYAAKQDINFTAGADTTSQNNVVLESGTTDSGQLNICEIRVTNIATQEKSFFLTSISQDAAGGGTVPTVVEKAGKWANTSAAISGITWTNTGTGDFAIGSEIVVLGHD